MKHLLASIILLAGVVSQPALAKTYYVEIWGSNGGDCSKAAPCNSIIYPIENLAGNNDRIVVGPGTYEGHFTIFQDGLKLTSVAGARGTTIEAGSDLSDLIVVTGQKVSIGQKRKGFTLTGVFNGQNAISETIPGNRNDIRIEDNIIFDTLGDSNYAIDINGGKSTVRYNKIKGFEGGINISSYGQDVAQNLVDENHVSDIGSDYCIAVGANENGKNKITDNVLMNCQYHGIYLDAQTGVKSGDRVQGNVIESSAGDGIQVYGGNPQIRKNAVRNAERGILIDDTLNATISDNLLMGGLEGLTIDNGNQNLTVKGNHMGGMAEIMVSFPNLAGAIKNFSRNNFVDYSCPIDFDENPAMDVLIELKGNYFSGASMAPPNENDPDLTCAVGTSRADTAYAADQLTFKPSGKLNPVKYKSDI